jgi:hypothetical protein
MDNLVFQMVMIVVWPIWYGWLVYRDFKRDRRRRYWESAGRTTATVAARR